jgi:hypothetical protein
MRRFSILGLMGFVFACGVALAALRNPSAPWAGIVPLIALGAVGTSVLGMIYERGPDRAWWVGFAVFGGGYMALTFAPGFAEQVQPKLGTTQALEYVHTQVTEMPLALSRNKTALAARRDALVEELYNMRQGPRRKPNYATDPSYISKYSQLEAVNRQLDLIHGERLFSAPPSSGAVGPAPSANRWQAVLPGAVDYDRFLRVGHSLFTILAGWTGGIIAWRFHRKQAGRPVADDRVSASLPEAGGG